jgi:hypothetical protein
VEKRDLQLQTRQLATSAAPVARGYNAAAEDRANETKHSPICVEISLSVTEV